MNLCDKLRWNHQLYTISCSGEMSSKVEVVSWGELQLEVKPPVELKSPVTVKSSVE